MVTGVREHDGRVWLGSLHEPAVACVAVDSVDLGHRHRARPVDSPDGPFSTDHVPADLRDRSTTPSWTSSRPRSATSWSAPAPHRRPPRPQPRRRRADDGDPPGLRLAARPGGLRHRPPGLRAQDAHRPGRQLRHAAQRGRPVAATRARPSPTTTSSRTPTPPRRFATPTAWPRPTRSAARTATSSRSSATARSPAAWPGRRSTTSRVAKDRRAGHRRQRQRPLLHADHRRPRQPP